MMRSNMNKWVLSGKNKEVILMIGLEEMLM